MKEEKKSSIIKEALTDFNAIMEAAEENAKKKLAEEYPNKFNKLLKEEINNKNKAKESYKKIDNAEESEESDEKKSNKESDMEKNVDETVKVVDTVGKGEPFDEKAKTTGVKASNSVNTTHSVGKSNPFTEKKGVNKIEEEREKEFTGDVEGETPNLSKGDKGIAFKEKLKGGEKPISNITEEFNISELDMDSVGSALDGAGAEDEVITYDQIEEEISRMEGLGEELQDMSGLPRQTAASSPIHQNGDAYTQLVDMRNKIDEMINSIGGGEMQTEEMNLQADEMSPQEFSGINETELEESITDADIDAVLGTSTGEEESVEESLGVSHSANRGVYAAIPGNDYVGQGQLNRRRDAVQENKKMNSLIEENKKLTKKLNESKKLKETASTLVEQYKSALEKYRNQLKEMAIFNTNLAHVNNLLVNESLALTQDDKIKIINEFKKVDSITESQNKYKSFLTEMKESKKTISESLEDKVSSTSIQPSSKQKLDEVVEKTAYSNDNHMNKMKKIIDYVENRGKKK